MDLKNIQLGTTITITNSISGNIRDKVTITVNITDSNDQPVKRGIVVCETNGNTLKNSGKSIL